MRFGRTTVMEAKVLEVAKQNGDEKKSYGHGQKNVSTSPVIVPIPVPTYNVVPILEFCDLTSLSSEASRIWIWVSLHGGTTRSHPRVVITLE